LLDIGNRLRNLLGNYRYVSYQMRLWKIQSYLRSGDHVLETRLIKQALKQYGGTHPWISLDLGCGSYPRNPFGAEYTHGCDIREDLEANISRCNLALEPIPKASESIDFVTAYEFIEHMPRVLGSNETRFPFVELMSEIHRVLKSGGLFFAKTPVYPSEEVFQDPTHVNMISSNTFPYYFCWHPYGGPWGKIYGFKGKFALLTQRRQGAYLYSLLRKVS
jgi:SAM-dependent methyltransferase